MSPGSVLRRLAVSLLVLALASHSALCVINGTETDTFESLSVVVIDGEQAISGKDASAIRVTIDKYGNNDSRVSALEVSEFESRYEEYVREFGNEYTLNGNEGQFTNIVATFKNAEGPVNSTAEITYEYQGRIAFSGVDKSLGMYTYRVVNEGRDLNSSIEIQITVPSGYRITATQGIYVPETSDGNRTVSGQTLTDANIEIQFEPYSEWDWLVVSLIISGIVSAVLAAAIVLSGRKGKGAGTFGTPQGQQPGGEQK